MCILFFITLLCCIVIVNLLIPLIMPELVNKNVYDWIECRLMINASDGVSYLCCVCMFGSLAGGGAGERECSTEE